MADENDDFVEVASLQSFPESGILSLEVKDRFIVLAKIDEKVYCIDDLCTHDGGPLGEGHLSDYCLICPRHGAPFDVRTGCPTAMPATEPTLSHAVRIDGDKILVKLSDN